MSKSSRLGLGLASLAVAACASAALVPAASAAPGNPGVPSDPTVIFQEGFENELSDGELVTLEDYLPTADKGTTYTADSFWLDASAGNGLIVDGTTPDGSFTSAGYGNAAGQQNLRALAAAIGAINGSANPQLNHVVSAYTDANGPDDAVEFRTEDPVDLAADGRFLTISANVGVANCAQGATQPELLFLLDDDGDESAVNATPLQPCPAGASDLPVATTIRGGNAVLFENDEVGIVIRNANGSGAGNDHAFDDVRVLDVTPQLDKQFEDEGTQLSPGDVTNLVFTITNTSELGVKTGWGFVDQLPEGLTAAGEGESTCAAGDVEVSEDGRAVRVLDGSLAAGAASCTVTVPVTADEGGIYENSSENVDTLGLNAPGATQVEYVTDEDPSEPGDSEGTDVAAPDTGAERSSMLPAVAALAAGGALLGGLGLRQARRRS